MNITQKEVLETADLLNINIREDEIEQITKSFKTLVEYFDILNQVEIEDTDDIGEDDIARFRDGEVGVWQEPEALIEKSEEYEDNYVLIPNVL